MGSISVSLPNDGETIDVADYNTPITTIVNAINGNLDGDNLAANAVVTANITDGAVTNAKLNTTAGELGGVWKDYTPTLAAVTEGNGTKTAKYTQIGKTVIFNIRFILGSTSAITGSPTVTLPVTTRTYWLAGQGVDIGSCSLQDAGVKGYTGTLRLNSTTVAGLLILGTSGLQTAISSTVPFTWATGDELLVQGMYEAA